MSRQVRDGRAFGRRAFLRGAAGGAAGLWLGRRGGLRAAESPAGPAEVEKDLVVHTESPMNAEPELEVLCGEWITPLEHFYVRSHGKQVPEIDPRSYRLKVEGLVERPLELSLAELRETFKSAEAVATLTCAGNRRNEFEPKAEGVQWRAGAIGNARWGGVRLAEVLKKAGIKEGARHVWFDGLDEITEKGKTFAFGASVPLDKVMEDADGVPGALLAQEMNRQPLAAHHGYPLRTVVPGYIGARSVKWLGRIVVSDRPSDNHYVAEAYKLVKEATPEAWKQADILYGYAVNGYICAPPAGARLKPGAVTVRGYALGQDGSKVRKVEVRAAGSDKAVTAKLTSPSQRFAWQLWSAEVPVTPETDALTLVVTDAEAVEQPRKAVWNPKGYMYNARPRVGVKVE